MNEPMTLAEYKAQIDEKYSGMRERQAVEQERRRAEAEELKRKDHWLLVDPNGEIGGVMTKRYCKSATQAFEEFYPKKKDRYKAAAEGWHIESDDVDGSRWAAECGRRNDGGAS